MEYSYKKLWKLLIDKKMKKKDLIILTGIAPSTMARMGKGDPVSLEVLARICKELKVNIGDVLDIIF